MKNYKFHYVYRVTSLIENKHYYGSRTSILEPKKDLGIKYFTSSNDKLFKDDFKSNPHKYKLKIVSIFTTREATILFEIKLHNKFDVGKNPIFYNQCKQTSKRFDFTGRLHSDASKKKMSESKSGDKNQFYGKQHSNETKQKISDKNSGENHPFYGKQHTDETKQKMSDKNSGENHPFYGKKHTDETKQKISENVSGDKNGMYGIEPSNKGKKANEFLSTEQRQYLSDRQRGELNHMYGKKISDEIKEKIRNKLKGRTVSDETIQKKINTIKGKPQKKIKCPHCGVIGGSSNMSRYHLDNCKNKQN